MSDLMTKILPLALAGAISPTVLAVVLVVLSGKEDPKLRGLAFLAGTTTVVVAISLLVVFVLGAAVPDSQKGSNSDLSGYVDLGFAVLLLALAALTFSRRNHHHEKHHDSARQPGARLPRFYALGLLIMIFNFTPIVRHDYRIGVPEAGTYRELFNSDSTYYGGSNVGNGIRETDAREWMGRSWSISLTLPPLAGIVLALDPPESASALPNPAAETDE